MRRSESAKEAPTAHRSLWSRLSEAVDFKRDYTEPRPKEAVQRHLSSKL